MGIKDAVLSGKTTSASHCKRIILPSSFTGGPRYIILNYQDAMAICKVVGYPDLFTTFICNLKWPKIENFLKNRKLNVEDRPNIVCRTFKTKLDLLIKDIRMNKIFGRVCKANDIDKIISAKIPDKELNPEYFEVVEKHMMHGPCELARKDSPCMKNGKCIRHFSKRFVDPINIDDDGYPVYRRREDGRTISKFGIDLDNRYVVPHNRLLLMRYGAHINVEWCNHSRSFKYLFKYVNKEHDRVTASFYKSATEDAELDEYDEAKGSTSYEEIRTVDGVLYSKFKDAYYVYGLLDDDMKYIDVIEEAGLILMDDDLKDLTLMEIEKILNSYKKSLINFSPMPIPDMNPLQSQYYGDGMNRLICDELCYDKRQLAPDHATYMQQLTNEQTIVHKTIMQAVENKKDGILLVIPKGTRLKVVKATINSSYIWNDCKLLTLTKNMRLKLGDSNTRLSELKKFADWILGIGDGSHGTPSDLCQKIVIPQDILVKD
ncbi:uncharacterized protein [Arachis hypogaea]|uniref:uncharacterized protein n=1 Tax=Arachis hypogaea TaxID=3818 RepID=UPI003B20BD1F